MQKNEQFYLKDDVYFEPLVNHWYAWPYLIPPVTAARYMVNTHRRLMMSFINNYELHIMGQREKGMAGAEFLNCGQDQVPEIQRLVKELEEDHADIVALSNSVKELDELLRQHTSGESIDPLYAKVPAPLRGYVELFLDMEHRASYRLIEPLLYRSPLFKRSLQSISFGMLSRVGERPFILSTPRLPDENHLHMKVDFNNPLLDAFFKSREAPLPRSSLEDLAEAVPMGGGLKLSDLFARTRSRYSHERVQKGVKLSYTGHAGFLLETRGVAILIDPVIPSRGESYADDIISYSQLPDKIDYICLTHNHQDHVNLETLLQMRFKTDKVLVPKNNGGTLADPSIRLLLRSCGFSVVEMDDLDAIDIEGGSITSVPFLGEHGDLNIRSKTAWYVELLGRRFFFGADSSNPDNNLYLRLGKLFRDVDILAIGMECIGAPYTWLYGALYSTMVSKAIKDSRRLNGSDCRQAFPMVQAFNAKHVLIYALGREPWYKYFMGIEYNDQSKQIIESEKMVKACAESGIPAEALFASKPFYFDEKA